MSDYGEMMLGEKITKLESENVALSTANDRLTEISGHKSEDLHGLVAKHEALFSDYSALQQQNTALQQQVKDLQAEKEALDAYLQDFKSLLKPLTCQLKPIELAIMDYDNYANTLSSKGG